MPYISECRFSYTAFCSVDIIEILIFFGGGPTKGILLLVCSAALSGEFRKISYLFIILYNDSGSICK